MKEWATHVIAVKDGEQKKFKGPYIPGETQEDAQKFCEENGLGYLIVEDNIKSAAPDGDPVPPDPTHPPH